MGGCAHWAQQTTIMKENSARQQENAEHDPKNINRCPAKQIHRNDPKNILENIFRRFTRRKVNASLQVDDNKVINNQIMQKLSSIQKKHMSNYKNQDKLNIFHFDFENK